MKQLSTIFISIILVATTVLGAPLQVYASTPRTFEVITEFLSNGIDRALREQKLTPIEARNAKRLLADFSKVSAIAQAANLSQVSAGLVDSRETLQRIAGATNIDINGVSDFFASAIFTLSSVIVNLTDSSQRIQDLERQMACLAGSMHISKSEKSSILKLIDKVEAETSDRINECEVIISRYNEENSICMIL